MGQIQYRAVLVLDGHDLDADWGPVNDCDEALGGTQQCLVDHFAALAARCEGACVRAYGLDICGDGPADPADCVTHCQEGVQGACGDPWLDLLACTGDQGFACTPDGQDWAPVNECAAEVAALALCTDDPG